MIFDTSKKFLYHFFLGDDKVCKIMKLLLKYTSHEFIKLSELKDETINAK